MKKKKILTKTLHQKNLALTMILERNKLKKQFWSFHNILDDIDFRLHKDFDCTKNKINV